MKNEHAGRRIGLFRSRRHREQADLNVHETHTGSDGADCFWKAAGLCPGKRQVDTEGRMVCICAQVLMAPSPDQVIDAFTDLGLTDEQIGHYFHIPTICVRALRQAV